MARPAQVVIVGAGMAGASAARHLAEAGFAVSVFDKGRQVGGRMATRRDRETGLRFDHGAQLLRAHGPAFRDRLDDWRARGIVAPWDAPGADAAVPDMTAPVRDLLAGLEVHVGRTVTGLTRDAAGWRLALAEASEVRVFDALVLTAPAPQAERLLGSAVPGLAGLAQAAYAPCWSLMLAVPQELPFAGDVLRPGDGPIAAVFRESTKPGRSGGAPHLTLHASPDWSAAHLEETPEAVQAALLAALGALLGTAIAPIHLRAHRWRYALVTGTCGAPCLYDPAARVGYAGDACLGPRVEAAYDSGAALAGRLAADLG
ncbi:FAD-dependent oxidoreductase [Methylobacterium sp. J-078]|uniref:NAD(P)/FAD-dependent oxidoreductase n=1 Tax=Methylobacterium sp. J-078 TaxID=2836657 RepID=UPI001FBB3BC0|nr:FAD-dependent oxidoreductase [Methylobacterium sp. J-078]MCJ2047281.1 FAD-dependent oxidoreductase [Methylobacterium sp. J-078]